MIKLLDIKMNDGSRHFLDLPKSVTWDDLNHYLKKLKKSKIVKFLPDHIFGSWLDFSFNGYTFSVNEQSGRYWFFVDDPSCPEEMLQHVADHLSVLFAQELRRD